MRRRDDEHDEFDELVHCDGDVCVRLIELGGRKLRDAAELQQMLGVYEWELPTGE